MLFIEADDLIEKMKSEMLVCEAQPGMSIYFIFGYSAAFELVDMVARLSEYKWHPASELPQEDGDYLTIWNFNNGKPSYRVLTFAKDARRWDKNEFKDNWKNKWIEYDREHGFYEAGALFWMPLPKAPESIEQERTNE